jgi:hypothetical protein
MKYPGRKIVYGTLADRFLDSMLRGKMWHIEKPLCLVDREIGHMLQPSLLRQSIRRKHLRELIGDIAYQQEEFSHANHPLRDRDRIGQVTPGNLHCIGSRFERR